MKTEFRGEYLLETLSAFVCFKGLALKTSYDYDIAGVRSSKTVGTTKYSFTTLSGLVMRQEWGTRQKGKTGVPFGTPVLV